MDDLARALLHWAATDHAGPLHLVGDEVMDRADLARVLARMQGADPSRIREGRVPPSRPRHLHLVSRYAELLPGPRARTGQATSGPTDRASRRG